MTNQANTTAAANANPTIDAIAKNHVVTEARECRKSSTAHFPNTAEITKSIATFPEVGSCIHRSANALLIDQKLMPSPLPAQISLGRNGAVVRATFRRLLAAFRLGRTSFEACGPYALWKPPRYFSASKSERLVTARRNQVGEGVRVFPIVEAPRKFIHVERKILFADFVIRADDPALE